jgi:predicted HTH domain antitoxin
MNSLTIHFELPATIASQAGLDADNINQDAKMMFALFLYEHKRISLSKACEISGISHWEFFEMNRRLGIRIPYAQDDLTKDMEKLSDV